MAKTKRKVRTADIDAAPAPAKVPAVASAAAALPEGAEVPGSVAKPDVKPARGGKPAKQKPLVLCARGITYRYRHLMTDLMQLLPHHKTDSKLDTKHDWNAINEVAELKGATSVMFFETRKRTDLYMWLSKCPSGPSARFLCTNVHTMAELKLSGNHLKGSRPVLSFDAAFDEQPQLQVMKELLQQVFVTPQGHQKSKPFFDHVISFFFCDNRIWLRNYQVLVTLDKKKVTDDSTTLIEVGPRVTLQPIKVFAGSFRGKVLFENPEFINPNAVRAYEKRKASGRYDSRVQRKAARQQHKDANAVPEPALTNRRVFAKSSDTGDSSDDEHEGVDLGGAADSDSGDLAEGADASGLHAELFDSDDAADDAGASASDDAEDLADGDVGSDDDVDSDDEAIPTAPGSRSEALMAEDESSFDEGSSLDNGE